METPAQWLLDPTIAFLNHGSFGACPVAVLEAQRQLREQMEREPVRFFVRELEPLLDQALGALGAFVGAEAEDLAFVPNATTAVNAVLRSLVFEQGDELLITDHAYNACRNALEFVARSSRARVVVAPVPFPIDSPARVIDAVLSHVSDRTRLALLDHVTSPTGLVLPIAQLVAELARRGVDTLIDGAHAPGMVPLDLQSIGAAYYAANCHKWLCAPKGAGFLHVRRDRQGLIRPTSISHGANSPRTDRSRFRLEFDWIGTDDPTAYLSVPTAISYMGSALPGGWPALMAHNHATALGARRALCAALGIRPPSPEEMIGALAAVPITDGTPGPPASPVHADPVQDALFELHRIEVPVIPWPAPPRRLLRISAQIYNSPAEYVRLAAAVVELLRRS